MPGRVVRENKILVSTCIMELRRNDIVPKSLQFPAGYPELLQELKTRIRTCQVRAALAVNREMVLLYWSIGRDILARKWLRPIFEQGWRFQKLPSH